MRCRELKGITEELNIAQRLLFTGLSQTESVRAMDSNYIPWLSSTPQRKIDGRIAYLSRRLEKPGALTRVIVIIFGGGH